MRILLSQRLCVCETLGAWNWYDYGVASSKFSQLKLKAFMVCNEKKTFF